MSHEKSPCNGEIVSNKGPRVILNRLAIAKHFVDKFFWFGSIGGACNLDDLNFFPSEVYSEKIGKGTPTYLLAFNPRFSLRIQHHPELRYDSASFNHRQVHFNQLFV